MNMHNTGFVDPYGKPLFKSILETDADSTQATILDDPANAF